MSLKPDGVFLSNGPGDPSTMDQVVDTVRELLLLRGSDLWYLFWPSDLRSCFRF